MFMKSLSADSLLEGSNRNDQLRIGEFLPPVLKMISVLAQERVLGAALGSALAGFVVFEERKRIYESISYDRSRVSARNQIQEPIFGKSSRSGLAHMWNQTVDKTLGPVIEYLSSHGW